MWHCFSWEERRGSEGRTGRKPRCWAQAPEQGAAAAEPAGCWGITSRDRDVLVPLSACQATRGALGWVWGSANTKQAVARLERMQKGHKGEPRTQRLRGGLIPMFQCLKTPFYKESDGKSN